MAEAVEVNEPTSPEPEEGQEEEVQQSEDTEAVEKDASSEGDTESKETKTLLSDDEGDGSDGVPDKYEFTPPEGFGDISEEAQSKLDQFGEKARGLKLSQDQFQSLVEYEIETAQQAQVAMADAFVERVKTWGEEVKADKELGGESLESNLALAKRASDAYGDDSFRALIGAPSAKNPDGLGLGNHPGFIRFLYRVGKSIGDSDLIEGDGHKASDADALQRMYPSMFEQAS
jgi:hypothetical protein